MTGDPRSDAAEPRELAAELDVDDALRPGPAQRIADLDPLGASPCLARLPAMNREADLPAILAALRAIAPASERAARFDVYEAAAAIRDLGMLLASARRHGVEPAEAVPEVEAVMLRFGETTAMVPRETVLHYTLWNPTGELQRRFTDDPSEAGLIDAVRLATPWIETTVELLIQAFTLPPTTGEFVELCAAAADQLVPLAESMKVVRRRVDPHFFATELRPYFEPIRLGGRRYSGAAAAPLAVGIVDHLLWSSDFDDRTYRECHDHLMEYGLPRDRRLYAATLGRPSIVTRFCQARAEAPAPTRALAEAERALDAIFKVLFAFRSRHTVVAKAAYAEKIRRYPVGSAGYGVDTLQLLLQQTKDARRRLGGGA